MTVRIHQLAKELGVTSKEIVEKLQALKIDVKGGHMSTIEDKAVEALKKAFKVKVSAAKSPAKTAEKKAADKKTAEKKVPEKKKTVKKELSQKTTPVSPKLKAVHEKAKPVVHTKITATAPAPHVPPAAKVEHHKKEVLPKPEEIKPKIAEQPVKTPGKVVEIDLPVNIKQLSSKISVKPTDIIGQLLKKGMMVTINQDITDELAREIASWYGYEITKTKTLEEEILKEHADEEDSKKKDVVQRHPVVTFMGHVDHGKTSLLDYIRKTKVASREKGGITQHIGAYKVHLPKGSVTFLDTPGHEAFTAMRARGASATDLVVLVVAADDGVMPQTREAIDHARAAGVPIVVAINKCDLPYISLDKIKRQLSELDLMPEDWGGKTIMVPVSAKTGQGVDQLLEMLLLESEMLELKANPTIRARGVVVEAKLCPGKGVVSTLLVKNGTLRIGDTILSGLYYGRIKAMMDDRGHRVESAPPSTPVEVLGLQGVPEAGDEFFVVKDEKKAKTLALLKQEEKRNKELRKSQRVSLEHLYEQIKEGKLKELKIIVKADVQGSLEAIQRSFDGINQQEVKLKIIHTGVGNINESDIMLAVVTDAIIIGFTVKIDPQADELAKKENIEVKVYDIIYEAINDVKAAMEGLLEPILKEVFQGRAKVQQVFRVTKLGFIAGSIVMKGTIARSHGIKVLRAGQEVYKGKIRSLKRFKDDVRDVSDGIECGIALEGFTDIKSGDIIESFTIEKVARRLESRS